MEMQSGVVVLETWPSQSSFRLFEALDVSGLSIIAGASCRISSIGIGELSLLWALEFEIAGRVGDGVRKSLVMGDLDVGERVEGDDFLALNRVSSHDMSNMVIGF